MLLDVKIVLGITLTTSGLSPRSIIPLSSETHSGEDVGIYASGPVP